MIPFIGLASGIGAGNPGCGEGPLFLKKNLPFKENWEAMILPPKGKSALDAIAEANQELANEAARFVKNDQLFISFGGDHSSGIGVWSGVAEALRPRGDLGLLWIDAHMDGHTPQSSESGNIHGMPLAALLGKGEKRLTQISDFDAKVKPENVALIGVRSFESGEAELLKSLNVRVYFMEEVNERGLDVVMQEALETISARTAGIGISFDLDSIDPTFAPAVGTPVAGGIDPKELLACLSLLQKFPLLGFEFVEYIPHLDPDLRSFAFIEKLIKVVSTTFLSKKKQLDIVSR
jgi:arginase